MGVTHTFVSAIADDPAAAAAGQVLPSHWNAGHTISSPLEVAGNSTAGAEIRLPEDTDNGSNYVALKSPDSLAASYTLTLPANDGSSGEVLTTDGSGVLSWAAGGGAPGGSSGQLQYNNAGAFGGTSGITTTGTELTIASGTKTASAPVIDATQTWNNAAVTFTGLKLNVTNTASNSASLLADLQVGGTSEFQVDNTGKVLSGGLVTAVQFGSIAAPNTGMTIDGTTKIAYRINSSDIRFQMEVGLFVIGNNGALSFTSGNANTAPDAYLYRDGAANTLAQRNGTNAQTLRVYNTYTDASNYERGKIAWDTNVLKIGTEKAGTGTARALELQTDGTSRLTIATNAAILTGNSDGWTSSGNLGLATHVYLRGMSSGVLRLTNFAATDFDRLQFGGVTSSFPALKRSSTALQVRLADDSAYAPLEASTLRMATAYTVATLPAAGTAGRRAYVTDATTPTFLGALTGGGAVVCPVFDNGTAWVAG